MFLGVYWNQPVCPSICVSICVPNTSNFVSQTPRFLSPVSCGENSRTKIKAILLRWLTYSWWYIWSSTWGQVNFMGKESLRISCTHHTMIHQHHIANQLECLKWVACNTRFTISSRNHGEQCLSITVTHTPNSTTLNVNSAGRLYQEVSIDWECRR